MQKLEFGASARRNSGWRYRLQMGPEQQLTFGRQNRAPIKAVEAELPTGHMEVFSLALQKLLFIAQEKQI